MSASHGKPRSVQASSALSYLESSNLDGCRSDRHGRLLLGGKLLRVAIAIVVMFACALTPALLRRIPAMAGIKQSFLLGLCCRVVLGVSI
ncbi:hypothetical protein E4J66_11435 [Actinomyces viscosus]|nr:hypothetical protein E4J66_11435 [Actinomyces viscosus]